MIIGYILDGHEAVPCEDLMEWVLWMGGDFKNRIVQHTHLIPPKKPWWVRLFSRKKKSVLVSTVFLGTNHSWGEGPPSLFETMVFGGPLSDEQERYSTWDEAVEGHKAMVKRAQEAM